MIQSNTFFFESQNKLIFILRMENFADHDLTNKGFRKKNSPPTSVGYHHSWLQKVRGLHNEMESTNDFESIELQNRTFKK